jgi:hypothetical protein
LEKLMQRHPGEWATRADIARALHRPKSAYLIRQIEACVSSGQLVRKPGRDDHNRQAWVYAAARPFPVPAYSINQLTS